MKKLRILFLSQMFSPEFGAGAMRSGDLAKEWSRAGHQVAILTSFPNYPTGKRYDHKIQLDPLISMGCIPILSHVRQPAETLLCLLVICGQNCMNISRVLLTRLPRTMFDRPQRNWLRKNNITSAISAVQKIPAPLRRRLITLRMAFSTEAL